MRAAFVHLWERDHASRRRFFPAFGPPERIPVGLNRLNGGFLCGDKERKKKRVETRQLFATLLTVLKDRVQAIWDSSPCSVA